MWWRGESAKYNFLHKNPSINWCYLVYGVRVVVTQAARPELPVPAKRGPAQSVSDSRRERRVRISHYYRQWQNGQKQSPDAGLEDGARGEYRERQHRGRDDSRDVLWPGVLSPHRHGHSLRSLDPHPHLQCHPHPGLLMVSASVYPVYPPSDSWKKVSKWAGRHAQVLAVNFPSSFGLKFVRTVCSDKLRWTTHSVSAPRICIVDIRIFDSLLCCFQVHSESASQCKVRMSRFTILFLCKCQHPLQWCPEWSSAASVETRRTWPSSSSAGSWSSGSGSASLQLWQAAQTQ